MGEYFRDRVLVESGLEICVVNNAHLGSFTL